MNDAVLPGALLAASSRILVIDDNQAIHQDFHKIFGASRGPAAPSAAEQALFGAGPAAGGAPEFQVDSAYQGEEGLALVRLAQEQRNPYAMAFVDVRMPPGWDGLETTAQIWRHDPDIQIVICTAYSDYSWSEMLAKLGRSDRLVILKKPFDTIEVVQLASALTEKWRLARQSRSMLEHLEHKVAVRTRELLQASDIKGAILESSLDGIITIDHEGKIVEFNPAAEAAFGIAREDARGQVMVDLIVPPRLRDAHRRGFAHYLATGEGPILGKRLELEALRADGSEFPIELAITAIGATSTPMFTGFIRDITARKEADEKIRRLNRVYAVLSGINALIVRARARDELFGEACRIAVEVGELRMAWIGVVNRGEIKVDPVASAGADAEFLSAVKDRFNLKEDTALGNTLTARAIRSKKVVVSNDIENDPSVAFGKTHVERGIRCMAILPLVVSDEVVGVLALYALEVGFFDEEELKLLTELAGDIAFALQHIEKAEKLARITRVNAVLSGINSLIVRVKGRDELLSEACRIAAEQGNFGIAWIGSFDPATLEVTPIAWAGAEAKEHIGMATSSTRGDLPQGQGAVGRAIRELRPAFNNDISVDTGVGSERRANVFRRGYRSLIALPLTVAGAAVGNLSLYAKELNFFDEGEVKLLAELAGNISFALEHIGKAEKLDRITRVNAMLSGINAAIVRIRERQELFEEACRIAVETGGLRFAWLSVVDEAEMRLRPIASAGADASFLQIVGSRLSLRDDAPEGHGISARSVRERRALVVHDIEVDANFRNKKEHAARGIKSVAILPLLIAARVVGVLGLHAAETGFFDDDEMELVKEVAGNIAFALEHIEKEEKVRRLTRVQAVLSGINAVIVRAMDSEGLFKESCRIAVEEGKFAMAWVGTFDPAAQEVTPVAWAGESAEALTRAKSSSREDTPAGTGAVGRSIRERRPVFNNDITARPFGGPRLAEILRLGFRSQITLPLYQEQAIVATLTLYTKEPNFFDAEELRLLTELAGDISFALQNLSRQQKLDKLARIRAVSSETNAAIVRIGERTALLEETCRIVSEQGKFGMVWIGTIDEAAQQVQPIAWKGFSDQAARAVGWASITSSKGTLGEAIRTRQPSVRNDIEGELPGGGLRAEALKQGCRSSVCLPLMVDGRVAVLIVLFATGRGFFDEEELGLLAGLAGNISFALEHIGKAGKLERMTRVNAMLSGINAAIVRIRDRQELFQEACRIAVETGGLPFAFLCVLDEAEMRLRPVAFAGVDDGFLEAIRERLSLRDDAPTGYGIAARSVREKNVVVVNDAEADLDPRHRAAHAGRGIKSLAALPLFIAVKAVGTLVLHAAEVGFFDDDEMKLLTEVAGNIAFALEHIEKEEKVQRLTRVQAVLSGINTLIVRVKDRAALFDGACRIAIDVGRFRMAWIGMANAMRIAPAASAATHPQYIEFLKDRFWVLGEPPAGSLVDRAVREKKAIFSNDAQNDPRVRLREEHTARGTRSIAILPLLVADEAVGVLALYTEEADFFDAEELTLLTELAGDIAFALENLGRQQKLDKLARIRAISSQINAAIVRIREPEVLLRETCRIAVEHGKFDLVWTGLVDQEKQHIQPVAWNGFSSEVAHSLTWTHLGNPLMTLAEVLRTRKVAVRNDTSGESPVGTLRHQAMKQGYRSAACVPFMVDDGVVAAMILFAPEPGFFDAEELALLNEVAADLSFALQATQKQEQLDYLAYYDPLTGLANRRLFLERVAQYMRSAAAGGHQLALFFLDLERFRNINDSLGRPAGDALLKQVAAWLTRNLGDASLVARAGGDIFTVVLPEVRPQGNVARLLERTMDAFLAHPFRLNDSVFRITFKVGVALFPDNGAEVDTLFRNAEAALKKAKASGDRYLFYAEKMTAAVAGRLTLENQLRQALEREEFVLHYQPKVNLASGKLTSAEALIRWNDPQSGLVPPGRFIPVLEETGLIYEVGRWALRKAVADYLRWRAAGLPAVRIAVNVSPLQLRNRGFVAEIAQVVGIDPQAAAGLELEITESLIMEDVKHNIACLKAIRDMDVRIAIDDFGTGFSSLSYLAKLPVDTLKIDRSFVIDMTGGPEGLALVSTIINLAHSLKLKVVAEGVETEEQSRLLRLLNCDEMQGYLFSKPVPGAIFEASFLAAAPRVTSGAA